MSTPNIKGLTYIKDIISKENEDYLLQKINQNKWDNILSRKTQQYGYKYNYSKHPVKIEETTPIPDWLNKLKEKVYSDSNQVIINHYYPGQGIAPHIDNWQFGEKIVSITLNHGTVMNFQEKDGTEHSLYLEPRSGLILKNDARWYVKHGIDKRMADIVNNKKISREERISLTFRIYST